MTDDERPVSDWSSLRSKTLILTVTPGRSGTKLLSRLLRESAGITADHEPPPRVNYVLRSLVEAPDSARGWLEAEKLPAMAQRATGEIYAETSHLFCKGLIEPILDIGLRPRFIILRRPARETALSMFAVGSVPHRSQSGRLVLLAPDDPGVLPYPGWADASDYQLCYWYALEIERRQAAYARRFAEQDIAFHECQMRDLLNWNEFRELAVFVGAAGADRLGFERVIGVNANPRGALLRGSREHEPPSDLDEQERLVEAAVANEAAEVA